MSNLNISEETKQTYYHIQQTYYPEDYTQDQILADVFTQYIDRQESGVVGQIEKLHEFRDLLTMLDEIRSDVEYVRLQAEKYQEQQEQKGDEE